MVHSLDVEEFQNTGYSNHSEKLIYFTLTICEQVNRDDGDKIWDETALKNVIFSDGSELSNWLLRLRIFELHQEVEDNV